MRIIGGKFKGKRIQAPSNLPVRPTTDFAKEALFNILNNEIEFNGTVAMDLFSGTGNLTFELGSRGCNQITSVDKNFRCARFIHQTASTLEIIVDVVKADVFKFLNKKPTKSFDLILADPPYDIEGIEDIPGLVYDNNWLKPEGKLIIEHGSDTDMSEHPNFKELRKYGHVHFSFFE